MVHRSHTQVALPAHALQLALVAPQPVQQKPHDPVELSPDPNCEDHWLRWLRVCFGCETG